MPIARLLAFLVVALGSENISDAATQSPNVVVILADDLGWSDTTLFSTTKLYQTPNIARLAKRGMTFTNAHSASPLCSPTRASLLTGLSPARHGITAPNCHAPEVILKPTIGDKAGTRVPLVVCWPGHVKPESRSDVLNNTCDYYPTLLEMLSIKPEAGQKFDGASLLPTLLDKPLQRDAIYTFFPHNPPVPEWMPPAVSVHRGDWKLIRLFACGENGSDRWKLFNLRDDIGETNDLAAQKPGLVQELDGLLDAFFERYRRGYSDPKYGF